MSHTIRTERLLLRLPTLRDGQALARAIADIDVLRNTGTWPYPVTPEYARMRLAKNIKTDPRKAQLYVITLGPDVIGHCGIGVWRAGGAFELGYMIGKPWWGKGLMTEAARALCMHSFRAMAATTMYAGVFDDNPASVRVLEKLGFRYDGPSKPVWSVTRGRTSPGSDYKLPREGLVL